MRKHITTILLLGVYCFPLWSQLPTLSSRSCATTPLLASINKQYPEYHQAVDNLYQQALDQIDLARLRTEEDIYTIPIVVHIVWNEIEENIPDAQIIDQIKVLNEDFRRMNPDADQLRDQFLSIAADAKIEFELIEIVRIQTEQTFGVEINLDDFSYIYPDHVKETINGGSDAWDINSYLNIWVCAIKSDQFFGYAYPPSGLDEWPTIFRSPKENYDGVVINYKVFGRDLPPFETKDGELLPLNGRTTTHEIGHYFGLRHPWGDPDLTTFGCAVDDGLVDTPLSDGPSNFDCNYNHNSCVTPAPDFLDMVENFMDYSSDICRNTFTKNQVDLMRYVIVNHRPQLSKRVVKVNKRAEVLVYPNPATDFVNIVVNPIIQLEYQFIIRNLHQQIIQPTIRSNLYNNNHYRIDLSGQPAGIYIIEFLTNGQRAFSEMVVVME